MIRESSVFPLLFPGILLEEARFWTSEGRDDAPLRPTGTRGKTGEEIKYTKSRDLWRRVRESMKSRSKEERKRRHKEWKRGGRAVLKRGRKQDSQIDREADNYGVYVCV